jgi:hypothetical protein
VLPVSFTTAADRQGREREEAIQHLMRSLRAERLATPGFPVLSASAMRTLATEIVSRNGYVQYPVNEAEAIREVKTNREEWEYFGFAGQVRRMFKKIRGETP